MSKVRQAVSRGETGPLGAAVAGILGRVRRERGISLHELARGTGLSRVALSYFERRRRAPLFDTVERICAALNVRMSAVLRTAEGRNGESVRPSGGG